MRRMIEPPKSMRVRQVSALLRCIERSQAFWARQVRMRAIGAGVLAFCAGAAICALVETARG